MNRTIFTLSCLFIATTLSAQVPTEKAISDTFTAVESKFKSFLDENYNFTCDRSKTAKEQKGIVSTQSFRKLTEKYFSLAITDKDKTPIGTFASLDFTNNETKLNLNVTSNINSVSYLTVSTSLNVKDKTGSIFSNNTISSGFSGAIKYSIRRPNARIFYYKENCVKLENAVNFQKEFGANSIKKDHAKLIAARKRYDQLQALVQHCGVGTLGAVSEKQAKECADALEEKTKLEQLFVEFNKKNASGMAKAFQDSLVAFESENAIINGVGFWWATFLASYGSESYDLFDKTRIKPEASIFTETHNRFKIGGELNYFINLTDAYEGKYRLGRSRLISFGVYWENDNNIKGLKALKTPFTLITEANDTVHTTAASDKNVLYDASTTAFDQYGSVKFTLKYLTYWSKKRIWGLDLFTDVTTNDNLQGPLISAGAGIVFNIKASDETKPKVSFELFYKLVDITERLPTSKGAVIERNEIGITAAIPFQKFIL